MAPQRQILTCFPSTEHRSPRPNSIYLIFQHQEEPSEIAEAKERLEFLVVNARRGHLGGLRLHEDLAHQIAHFSYVENSFFTKVISPANVS